MRPSIVYLTASFTSVTRKAHIPLAPYLVFRRATHQSTVSRFKEITTNVPVGNNGHITLNILQPIRGRGRVAKTGQNVILYLPDGPLFAPPPQATTSSQIAAQDEKKPGSGATPQRELVAASLATVVTVNYRLDRDADGANGSSSAASEDSGQAVQKYPTPIHDTLAGFDWIFQHLKPAQLCVYGTRIGGSLAMMLALTEPRSLRAIAAKEPMCDWVGLDDYCQVAPEPADNTVSLSQPSGSTEGGSDESLTNDDSNAAASQTHRKRGRKKKQAPSDLVPLLESRSKLFRKPANYFDPFASPALFLRTPGKDCPKSFPTYLTGPEYPVPILQRPPNTPEDDEWYANLFLTEPDVDMLPEGAKTEDSTTSNKSVRRRKTLSRWPPYGIDYGLESYGLKTGAPLEDKLILPDVRIFVDSNVAQDAGNIPDADTILEDQLISRLRSNWQTTEDHAEQPSVADTQAEPDTAPTTPESASEGDPETQIQTQTDPSSSKDEPASKPRRNPRGSLSNIAKSMTGETVLARQSAEMVSLMHHACFWGHPAGFGEERVRLVRVPHLASPMGHVPSSSATTETQSDDAAMFTAKIAGKWFWHVFQEGNGGNESQ